MTSDGLIAPQATQRLPQLDGLRGVAALIVVFHHSMLLSASFAATYMRNGDIPAVGSALWFLTATPLKFLTAGGEAVILFFVLSGIVLTLPVLARRDFDWWSYYPRRVIRLYLPAIASVLFAGALILLVPEKADQDYGYWVNVFSITDPKILSYLGDMDLLFGTALVNSPLWSLRWEVAFSLALPIFVGLAVILRRRPLVWAALAFVIAGIGIWLDNPAFTFLPPFLIGAIIAVRFESLRAWSARVLSRPLGPLWAVGALVLAVILFVAYWLVRGVADAAPAVSVISRALSGVGSAVIVIVVSFWAPAVRFFSTAVVQWLGRISFSIYLIHVPIAFAAIHLLGPSRWWLATASTIVLALALGTVFTRFVERPSHTLSKRAGAAFSSRVRAAYAAAAHRGQ
ncbi:acyltransferase [soil metagenome]